MHRFGPTSIDMDQEALAVCSTGKRSVVWTAAAFRKEPSQHPAVRLDGPGRGSFDIM